MGKRLRIAAVAIILTASPAMAETFASCWVSESRTPFGSIETVTRCRISGGETVDYASDSSVPSVLYPNLGNDLTGECWYYSSAASAYVLLTQYADGSADIGYDTDPSTPGGLVAIGPTIPRCTSEPAVAADPAADAWAYAMSYIHDPPTPNLNPEPGRGITGLATYVGVTVPPDHTATLVSGTSTVEVEIDVDAVVVAGWPAGSATHVYEVHDPEGVSITVEFDWAARWRVSGGAWTSLPVPNTATSVDYPVAQVVSRLGD